MPVRVEATSPARRDSAMAATLARKAAAEVVFKSYTLQSMEADAVPDSLRAVEDDDEGEGEVDEDVEMEEAIPTRHHQYTMTGEFGLAKGNRIMALRDLRDEHRWQFAVIVNVERVYIEEVKRQEMVYRISFGDGDHEYRLHFHLATVAQLATKNQIKLGERQRRWADHVLYTLKRNEHRFRSMPLFT